MDKDVAGWKGPPEPDAVPHEGGTPARRPWGAALASHLVPPPPPRGLSTLQLNARSPNHQASPLGLMPPACVCTGTHACFPRPATMPIGTRQWPEPDRLALNPTSTS